MPRMKVGASEKNHRGREKAPFGRVGSASQRLPTNGSVESGSNHSLGDEDHHTERGLRNLA